MTNPNPIRRALATLNRIDDRLIMSIAERYLARLPGRDWPLVVQLDLAMIHATHGLDLPKLFAATDAELVREVTGLRANLDRETGELTNGYQPRFGEGVAA